MNASIITWDLKKEHSRGCQVEVQNQRQIGSYLKKRKINRWKQFFGNLHTYTSKKKTVYSSSIALPIES